MYVYCSSLYHDDGTLLATFSSHWGACAAMIRQSNPSFRSLGGDLEEDLAVERTIQIPVSPRVP
jgi:hypothetical protein